MIIKLLPNQIPPFWEAIKYARKQTDNPSEAQFQPLMNEMLHNLLSNKAQCWVMLNPDRVLTGMGLTVLKADKYAGCKYLLIDLLYAWAKTDESEWARLWNTGMAFARQEGCKYVSAHCSIPRAIHLAKQMGMRETGATFRMEL